MMLNVRNARTAVKRLNAMPHTTHVFAVAGASRSCMLVWVLKDGARHTLSTEEQVTHAGSNQSYL